MGKTTLVSELARTVLREESANGSMPVLALVAVFALALGKECTWDVLVFPDPFFGRVGSIPRTTGASTTRRVLPRRSTT